MAENQLPPTLEDLAIEAANYLDKEVAQGRVAHQAAHIAYALRQAVTTDQGQAALADWVQQQIDGIKRSTLVEASRGALAAFEQVQKCLAPSAAPAPHEPHEFKTSEFLSGDRCAARLLVSGGYASSMCGQPRDAAIHQPQREQETRCYVLKHRKPPDRFWNRDLSLWVERERATVYREDERERSLLAGKWVALKRCPQDSMKGE